MSAVALVSSGETMDDIEDAIEEALNCIDFTLSPSMKNVAIKPNLCYYWHHSTGETTNPRLIGALIDLIRRRTSSKVNISLVESDASAMTCKYAFKMLGYERLASEKSVELVNLSEDETQEITVTVNDRSREFLLPRTIEGADLFINVPKIKYMPHVKLSCALKNIYGCNPYPQKFRYHKWLDEAIVSLNKIMPPQLTVVDALVVRGTKTVKLGLIMVGTDPVAVDAAAARIAGLDPASVAHLVLASKEGIGRLRFVAKGAKLTYFRRRFPRKAMRDQLRNCLAGLYRFASAR